MFKRGFFEKLFLVRNWCSIHNLKKRDYRLIHIVRCNVIVQVNPHLPRGIGDKLLLRLLAFNLGLEDAACRPKRAMQFGSRIVHAEQDRAKGSDVCKRLRDVSCISGASVQLSHDGARNKGRRRSVLHANSPPCAELQTTLVRFQP